MYVSLQLSPQSRGPHEDLVLVEDVVERMVLADRAGIASVSLTEHHLGGLNTYCDPFLMGCYAASRLSQLYIAVLVVQVPLSVPLRVAEQANMLDLVMRGRCLVGLASGSPRSIELDAFGVDPGSRSVMTEQRVGALVEAWGWSEAVSPLDVSTEFERCVLAGRVSPSSFRRPHPLVGRATGTDATIVDCAVRGWPVLLLATGEMTVEHRRQADLYREALAGAGHDAVTVEECEAWLGPLLLVSLAETEREARTRLEAFLEGGGVGPVVTQADAGTPEWVQEWRTRQSIRAELAYCGTPETVAQHVRDAAEALGVDHVRVMVLDVPGEDERNMEVFQLFLDEVVPALDPQSLPGPARTLAALDR